MVSSGRGYAVTYLGYAAGIAVWTILFAVPVYLASEAYLEGECGPPEERSECWAWIGVALWVVPSAAITGSLAIGFGVRLILQAFKEKRAGATGGWVLLSAMLLAVILAVAVGDAGPFHRPFHELGPYGGRLFIAIPLLVLPPAAGRWLATRKGVEPDSSRRT